MDDLDEAIAWMRAEGAGYKKAAKRFGVDADALRAHARTPAREDLAAEAAPARPDPVPVPPLEDYLRQLLAQLDEDLILARASERWGDVAKLVAAASKARLDLEEARARTARASVPADETAEQRTRREIAEVEDALASQRARPRPDGAATAALMRRRGLLYDQLTALAARDGDAPPTAEEVAELMRVLPFHALDR